MMGQNFLKGLKHISVPGSTATGANRPSGEPRSQPSPTVDGFALAGASDLPDPRTHAYRKDLADTGLAGRVIASHYAEPLVRHLVAAAPLLKGPADDAEPIMMLQAGDELRMLDNSRGWAWGYGPDGRVGYVRSEAVAP